ncbi:MAG: hypothetical protein JWQ51_3390 [Tardiphaga sp.]|nr:hypothetical protein [Tardiphaga sp.]
MRRVMPSSPDWRGVGRPRRSKVAKMLQANMRIVAHWVAALAAMTAENPEGHATNADRDISIRLGAGFFLECRDQILADA